MRSGGGKSKGSAFERLIARELSNWLTQNKDDKQLIRSVLSGGWERSKTGAEGWRHAGDLAPNGPYGEAFRKVVAIECKHYREVNLWALWHDTDSKAPLWQWWGQAKDDATKGKVLPMLIFKANNSPIMVMLPRGIVDAREDAVTVYPHKCVVLKWDTLRAHDPQQLFNLAY